MLNHASLAICGSKASLTHGLIAGKDVQKAFEAENGQLKPKRKGR